MSDDTPAAAGENPNIPPEKPAKPKPKKAPKEKKLAAPEGPPLVLSSSPHIGTRDNIERAMYTVLLALAPAFIGAIIFFGLDAVRVTAWCVVGCLAFEAMCLRLTGEKHLRRTMLDGSAILTGVLLAFNLPSNAPWWLALAGAFVAMVIAKHVFGGLGANPFNPALVARIFLLIAWPTRMTSWPVPNFAADTLVKNPDAVTAATPLGVLGTDGLAAMEAQFPMVDVMLGNIGGCLGETSALLLLLGGIVLLARHVIRWEVPVAFIGTVAVLSTIGWLVSPDTMAPPLFHILAGGLFLGAFFMATDYVTSPLAPRGMLVFGIGCGVLTFVIRAFGSFPEGVSFAIVIMNSLVPIIDRYCVPKRFGYEKKAESAA